MKTSKFLILLTTAFLLCLSSCEDDDCPECPESVLFKGQYITYPNILDDADGVLTVDIPSEGTATDLGASTWSSASLVYANTNPPWTQTGDMVFEETATGDQLIGSFTGTSLPNPPDNPFMGSGEYVITSGTGKYAGVTGEGTYSYEVSPEMIGELMFTGILTYPVK